MGRRPGYGLILLVALIAAVLFFVAHLILRPAPIPALTALMGGVLVVGLGSTRRARALGVGATIGLVIGVLIHLYSHYSEGRMGEPPEGLALHLAYDAIQAVMVAVPILVFCVALTRRALVRDA